MSQQKSTINIILGCAGFGKEGTETVRIHNVKDVSTIFDLFQAHGHNELDTARMYCEGTSEEVIGEMDWQKRGLTVDTKLYPTIVFSSSSQTSGVISHSPEDLRKHLDISLGALKTDAVDIWYLHGPDRTTRYEVTLRAINELHNEGKFKRFGLSNFMSWEVAEIVAICNANGFVMPAVYQGVYNAMHRNVEPELLPCLRKHGISFYAFSPLGGGLFTGRYRAAHDNVEPGSRFDPTKGLGQSYRRKYWNETYFDALAAVEAVGDNHGLTIAEVALRWLSHHSLLSEEHGDAIIIGASSVRHAQQNLLDLEKSPLPDEVVAALDHAWASVKSLAANYFH